MTQFEITSQTTAQDLIALAPADQERAYRGLRDRLLDMHDERGSIRSEVRAIARLRAAGRYERADRAEQELERRLEEQQAECRRLDHLKALLARLTGRAPAGYCAPVRWQHEVQVVESALTDTVPLRGRHFRRVGVAPQHRDRSALSGMVSERGHASATL